MRLKDEEPEISRQLSELVRAEHPMSGTEDDDDDRDDEHAGENEASVHAVDENTEAPEEFEDDDEDAVDVADGDNDEGEDEQDTEHDTP
jgi:hypothetical protein